MLGLICRELVPSSAACGRAWRANRGLHDAIVRPALPGDAPPRGDADRSGVVRENVGREHWAGGHRVASATRDRRGRVIPSCDETAAPSLRPGGAGCEPYPAGLPDPAFPPPDAMPRRGASPDPDPARGFLAVQPAALAAAFQVFRVPD